MGLGFRVKWGIRVHMIVLNFLSQSQNISANSRDPTRPPCPSRSHTQLVVFLSGALRSNSSSATVYYSFLWYATSIAIAIAISIVITIANCYHHCSYYCSFYCYNYCNYYCYDYRYDYRYYYILLLPPTLSLSLPLETSFE